MKEELIIQRKNFWEIPGCKEKASGFYLPLNGKSYYFCCNSYNDQEVDVYTVNDSVVGYYQPSWKTAIFKDTSGKIHYCENIGENREVLPIFLENFNNGVQWTAIMDDGEEEEIFIQLV